jgi:hypothetical protein
MEELARHVPADAPGVAITGFPVGTMPAFGRRTR